MSDGSEIEWLRGRNGEKGASWQPVIGCTRKSAGCDGCYAINVVHRGMTESHRGLTKLRSKDAARPGPDWNGTVRLQPQQLERPLRWRKSRRVFVCSLADLFHEKVPFDYIAAVFGIMAASPQHTFLVLTKRDPRPFFAWLDADRMEPRAQRLYRNAHAAMGPVSSALLREPGGLEALEDRWPLRNVHLGASVEDQATADERIPALLECPAALHWVSYEPGLGPVDFRPWLPTPAKMGFVSTEYERKSGIRTGDMVALHRGARLRWIVPGGESGGRARPYEIGWARDVIKQAAPTDTAVFVKQVGRRPCLDGEPLHLQDAKGGDMEEWKARGFGDLCVRELPHV